jgi:hypothetical protein
MRTSSSTASLLFSLSQIAQHSPLKPIEERTRQAEVVVTDSIGDVQSWEVLSAMGGGAADRF